MYSFFWTDKSKNWLAYLMILVETNATWTYKERAWEWKRARQNTLSLFKIWTRTVSSGIRLVTIQSDGLAFFGSWIIKCVCLYMRLNFVVRNRLQCRLYLLYQKRNVYRSINACLYACLLARSFVGWLGSFYPYIHVLYVIHTILYYILPLDGDKRCETFLNCQIEGGRWGRRWWLNAREKRERTRASQHVYSVCLMRSLMCIVYVMVILVFRLEKTKKKLKLFPIFVPLLTLLAVLFFLVNTILTSIVHMSGVFLLSEWVAFFFTLRNRNEVKPRAWEK